MFKAEKDIDQNVHIDSISRCDLYFSVFCSATQWYACSINMTLSPLTPTEPSQGPSAAVASALPPWAVVPRSLSSNLTLESYQTPGSSSHILCHLLPCCLCPQGIFHFFSQPTTSALLQDWAWPSSCPDMSSLIQSLGICFLCPLTS